jgi:hypothetical protein
MATNYNPSIVTSGLVLHLDAANTKSYPGSGTTWSDLSGNGNASTLVNGPTYSSTNGGSIVFDGSNDYASFYAPSLSGTATIEIWCKLAAGFSEKMVMGWNSYDVYCPGGRLGYNTGNSDLYGISAATVTSLGCAGNWKQYIFEMRSDVSYTNNKIYVNGEIQTLSQQLATEYAATRNFNSGNGRIASWIATIGYEMPMNCAVFRVYNTALTATQILQNYNALRGRFGL